MAVKGSDKKIMLIKNKCWVRAIWFPVIHLATYSGTVSKTYLLLTPSIPYFSAALLNLKMFFLKDYYIRVTISKEEGEKLQMSYLITNFRDKVFKYSQDSCSRDSFPFL